MTTVERIQDDVKDALHAFDGVWFRGFCPWKRGYGHFTFITTTLEEVP